MSTIVNELEAKAGGVQPTIKLLGVSQANYYDYRNGRRKIPVYIQKSIKAHLALTNKAFNQLKPKDT